MTWKIINLYFLLLQIFSIKFDYHLNKHQFQCFSENVQKQTRYQIITKGQQPTYVFQVFEQEQSIHEDDQMQTYMKYYSAFSQVNDVVMFCLANMDVEKSYKVQIQFYHGIYLQQPQQQGQLSELQIILPNMLQVQNFIKISYGMYENSLRNRISMVQNIGFLFSIALIGFFIITAITRYLFLRKTIRYMRYRKII